MEWKEALLPRMDLTQRHSLVSEQPFQLAFH